MSEHGTNTPSTNISFVDENNIQYGVPKDINGNPISGQGNRISTTDFNSRDAATLAAGATYQGTSEDVSAYGRAGISITSTTATASGVLSIEVSHDGTNWGGPTRTWTAFNAPFMWNIVERYFRILYTNNGVEAENLSIQVQYSNNADIVLGHQINEILPKDTEGQTVRPTNEFALDTARVHIMGQSAEFFFGFNNAVGTSWEDVWAGGGDITWLTAATAVEIISTDAADNGTTPGLGVQSVEIHGLSATGVEQEEIILTNGTAAVQSANTYIRINKMHSETCGTYGGSHKGDITCRVTGGGATLAKMTGEEGAVDTSVQYGSGESGNGFYTVPLGKVMYITKLEVVSDIGTNKLVDVALYEREDILDVTTPFSPRRVLWQESGVDAGLQHDFRSYVKIKSLADIWFRAKGSATSKIEVELDFYLVDEDANGA